MKTPKNASESWDLAYQVRDIPWHDEHPPRELLRVLREQWFKKFVGADLRVRPIMNAGVGSPTPPQKVGVLSPRPKALDVGCGLGTTSIALSRVGFDVVGIDISKTAIEEARVRASELNVGARRAVPKQGSVHFEVQDAFDLRPYYGQFDLVIDLGCFHGFSGKWRKAFLKEIHRVLRNEGLYWVMTFGRKSPNYGPYRYSQKEMRELMSPLFKILFVRNSNWSYLYQRNPSQIPSLSCLMEKL